MRTKVGIGISFDEITLIELEKRARQEGLDRSALVARAVVTYLMASENPPNALRILAGAEKDGGQPNALQELTGES